MPVSVLNYQFAMDPLTHKWVCLRFDKTTYGILFGQSDDRPIDISEQAASISCDRRFPSGQFDHRIIAHDALRSFVSAGNPSEEEEQTLP